MPTAIASAAIAIAGLTILLLSGELPPTVASHFNAAGVPDSYMPRGTFVVLMLIFSCGVPLFIYGLQVVLVRQHRAKIAHADYWFDPERQAETVRWLSWHAAWGAAGLAGFLTHTFGLVVLAHRNSPVALSEIHFWTSLVLFLAATAGWVFAQHRRFNKLPNSARDA